MKSYYVFHVRDNLYDYHCSNDQLLGQYGPNREYYFAAFTRLIDCADYIKELSKQKR